MHCKNCRRDRSEDVGWKWTHRSVPQELCFECSVVALLVELSAVTMSVNRRVSALEAKVDELISKEGAMSQVVQDLVAEVAAMKTVEESAVALLNKLFAIVQSGIDSGDVATLQAQVDELKAERDNLAAAVTANTPAEPPPPTP